MTKLPDLADRVAPRNSWRLLRDPVVGPFFFGKILFTAGVWAYNITAAIVVFQLTGSAVLVGAVSIAQFAPQILLAPWCGARADRSGRRRQLIAGRLISAVGAGGLAVWIPTVGLAGWSGPVAVIAAALVMGVGFAWGGPAMESLLPTLVCPAEVPTLIALNALPATLARAAGPALGALLAALSGPTLAFAVAGATQFIFAVILAAVIRDPGRRMPSDTSLLGGLRQLRVDPALAALLIGTAAVGIGAEPGITLTPSIAEALGGGSWLVGALASAFGLGAVAAYAVLGVCRRVLGMGRLGCGGLLLLAAGLVGIAFSSHVVLALLCLGVSGIGMTAALTSFTTLIQSRAPDDLRGRIMALWAIAYLGSRPLAAALNGVLADLYSVATALIAVAGVLLLCAWIARPSRTAPPGILAVRTR